MRRYNDFVDQIDLEALYEALGWEPLYQRGPEDVGHCLFPENHQNGDRTGKFAVNREKHVANCWVCGGFTLPELVSQVRAISVQQAIDWLYQFSKPQEKGSAEFYVEIEKLLRRERPKEAPMPYFREEVLEDFEPCPEWWLEERHIDPEVAEFFQLKFDPDHARGDRKAPAVILPHFWNGQLVGWQERLLDEQKPKYTNTGAFPRDRTIWGYEFCNQSREMPIVVESVPTALYLISEGYPAMATFGGQIAEQQLKLLRAFHGGLILAPDNDNAGYAFMEKLGALQTYMPLFTVPMVDGVGSDLGDLEPSELSHHLKAVSLYAPFL